MGFQPTLRATSNDAEKWGELFYGETSQFSVVKSQIPKIILENSYYIDILDGIGPAYFLPTEILSSVKFVK